MKSWKTSVGGILAGIGLLLTTHGDGIYKTIGGILAALGTVLTGWAARDNKVTSESAGAK